MSPVFPFAARSPSEGICSQPSPALRPPSLQNMPQFLEHTWGMCTAIPLSQQLLGMPEEEYRHEGSREQDWGFDNAIKISQQPQGTL